MGSNNSIKNDLNERTYNNLANFVFNLLSLPYSFAVANHNFCLLSLIKTKFRKNLKTSNINNIMLCKELVKNNDPHYGWSRNRGLSKN